MSDAEPPSAASASRHHSSMATLFRFYELWLAERMPDTGRDAVFWQGARIEYDELKEGLGEQRKYFVAPSPYPGLRSFTPQEGRVFFGRRGDIDEVRSRLKAHRMVMILGGSGAGKSSLVRAGVLPHLNGVGRIGGRGGTWYWCEFRPEQAPLANFVAALAKHVVTPLLLAIAARVTDERELAALNDLGLEIDASAEDVQNWIAGPFDKAIDGDGLFDALWNFVDYRLDRLDSLASGDIRAGKPNILILLDQFEEIFREASSTQQREQIALLLTLLGRMEKRLREAPWSGGGLFMALTMRSEELHRCGEHDSLTDLVNRSVFSLKLLDPARESDSRILQRAIVEPARRVFISYDLPFDRDDPDSPFAPGVPAWLLEGSSQQWAGLEHRPDQLPLLQHALRSMWDHAVGRWKAAEGDVAPLIEQRDLPGDDLATPYPDLDRCLSNRADAAAEESRWRFCNYPSEGPPERMSDDACPPGEIALRAAFSALARQDDRGHRARRFALAAEMIPFLENNEIAREFKPLQARLENALSPMIFHGYLTGGGGRPYDISHEALIRNWEHCTRWLQQNEEIVRALRRFLEDIDPTEFEALTSKEKIAERISGAFRSQIALIGPNKSVPESWACKQLDLLLRAAPDRCGVWLGKDRGDAPPTSDEVAGVLARIQAIAARSRDARAALREEKARIDERAKQVPILEAQERQARESEKEARKAQAQAQQSEREARAAEGKAHRRMLVALASGIFFLIGLLGALSWLIQSRISYEITTRVLAISQIQTPVSTDWSHAVKLGVLKEAKQIGRAHV